MGQPLGQVTIKGSESFPLLLLDSTSGDRSHVARASLVPCGSPKSSSCQVILLSASFSFLLLDSTSGDRSQVARYPSVLTDSQLLPCFRGGAKGGGVQGSNPRAVRVAKKLALSSNPSKRELPFCFTRQRERR